MTHAPFAAYSAQHFNSLVEQLHGVAVATDATFPVEVNRRLEVVHDVAMRNAELAEQAHVVSSIRLALVSAQAPTVSKRLIWLRRSADAFSNAYAPRAACRAGCSHCCHIPMTITKSEAMVIARETGRVLQERDGREPDVEPGYNNPCPFLVDSKCSIYASRPLACRVHLNMDVDDLLCRLIPGALVPVPYADKRPVIAAMVACFGSSESADIRTWFRREEGE
jgi:Fe-S-cluster containining protein